MNPCMVFTSNDGHVIVRLKNESVEKYLTSPIEFKKLLALFADYWGYNTDENRHQALVIGDELRGRWVGCSPMGQEYTNPPYMWEFEQRINNALTSPIHSLVIWPDMGFHDDAAELEIPDDKIAALYEVELKSMIRLLLGADAFVSIEDAPRARTALDDALDNIGGGGFEGYN